MRPVPDEELGAGVLSVDPARARRLHLDAMARDAWLQVFTKQVEASRPDLSPVDLIDRARRIANEAEHAVRVRLADE